MQDVLHLLKRVRESKERLVRGKLLRVKASVGVAKSNADACLDAVDAVEERGRAAAERFLQVRAGSPWSGAHAEQYAQSMAALSQMRLQEEENWFAANEQLQALSADLIKVTADWARLNAAVKNVERVLEKLDQQRQARAEANEEANLEELANKRSDARRWESPYESSP